MRILHLVHQYLPDNVGGTELYTRWLAHAQSDRGHQVAIFYRRSAPGEGLEHRLENDVQVWAAWAGLQSPARRFLATFADPSLVRSFERVLQEVQPELIHVQHLMGLPVALLRLIQQREIPFVITLWDFWWVCANAQLLTNYSQEVCEGPRAYLNCSRCALARSNHPGFWPAAPPLVGLLAWRNRLLQQVMRASARLIAPTPFVCNWYASHKAPAEQLIVVPPGIEQPPALLTRQPHRPAELLRFAYIGGLSWQKGVHVLLQAFQGLEGRGELWIAGDESAYPDYVTALKNQKQPNVRFLGRLDRAAVWETLRQVDVVAVPSMWYETFSFIVSEAFAAGLPVIASRLGPLADRVQDGVNGLLVPPGDPQAWQAALSRFLDNPALLDHLRAGIGPVPTLEDHSKEIEAVYQEVLGRSS